MRISEPAVKRPVAVAMLFLIVILLGVVSLNKLNVDLFPELDLPIALSMTSYEGVGPEEIENLVTRPIEGAVGTVSGIKNISSQSYQGSSLVMVEFEWGTDMNYAINQMREKIDLIAPMLPTDADKSLILKMDPNLMPIMAIGFGGNLDLADLDDLAKDVIQPRLERVNGVASVGVYGGMEREIRISAVPQRLQAYGLSLDSLINFLRMENRNVSAGSVEDGLKEHTVRVTGEFEDLQEIENLQIPLPSGGSIRLAEIAKIEDTYKDKKSYAYMDGEPCVQISIQRQTDANTVKVSDAIRQELEELKDVLPQEAKINIAFDQAEFIRLSINNVVRNVLIGAVLAVFVLLLFLRNIRSTLIIGTAIPISIITTFILIFFGNLTLNMITLGGLALGVGMMVDSAIVILENIYRHREEGYSRIDASVRGADEVASAITASTLTTIVVFLPIVYVEGLASQIFRPMALTVTFALLASLLVALTLVPMLSSKVLKVNHNNGNNNGKKKGFLTRLSGKWGRLFQKFERGYSRVLAWSINNKKKVVFGTLLLFIGSIAMTPLVGMEFLPKQDTGEYIINIDLPNGTALHETHRVTKLVEEFIHQLPEHEWSFYSVGSSGNMFGSGNTPEHASVRGKLKDVSQRERDIDQVLDELRTKCSTVPGADIEIRAEGGGMGGGSGDPISIGIIGDNLEVLDLISHDIAERIKDVPGTREVTTSIEDGRPELHIKLNRERADLYGLTSAQLSSYVSTAVNGSTATRYRVKGDELDIRVILDEKYRQTIDDIEALTITSPTGALVPLQEVASLEIAKGPTQITRKNQSRRVTVSGDISGRDLRSVMQDIQLVIKDVNLPPGVQLEFGGENKDMMESFQNLTYALILAIILVYMILASQYESLLYPFVIMFAIPPTLIGVVLFLFISNRTLNVATFIGIIMLAGIVVNNAIVMVDYINTLRRRDGMSRKDAILKAGPTRLRPILMTTLTTILGLFPLVLGIGEGSELSAPMATAVFGGLSFSTVITLVLVPCMYIIMENMVQKVKKIFRRGDKKSAAGATVGGE